MSYYTETEKINLKLLADAASINSAILKDLIETDSESELKKQMRIGERYYRGMHDYYTHKNYYYNEEKKPVEITNKANNKATVWFYTLSENQKIQYLLGKDISITTNEPKVEDKKNPTKEEKALISKSKEFQTEINKELGSKFQNVLRKVLHGATRKSIEWLHFYVNPYNELIFTVTSALGIIPIYDMQYEDRLLAIIRYYQYPFINPQTQKRAMLYKVEKWTDTDVTYWEQHEDETFTHDYSYLVNPAPHWFDINESLGTKIPNSFGRIPFIPFYNNSQGLNDLQPIKELIDAYDKVFSGWANDLEDIKQLLLILKGYGGLSPEKKDELTDFLNTLYTVGAVNVSESGDVTNLKNEIPVDARERFLKLCRESIFEIGRMVDKKQLIGNMTNVGIQSMEDGLDTKANEMISMTQEPLEQAMYFITYWMNRRDLKKYDPREIKFTFNKSRASNDVEYMTALNATFATGKMSEQLYLEKSIYVDNVDEEIERLRADEERMNENNRTKLDSISDSNDYDAEGNIVGKDYTGERYNNLGEPKNNMMNKDGATA
jgi:SPP1 family phage portal protein